MVWHSCVVNERYDYCSLTARKCQTRYADIWHSRVVSERMRFSFFFYKKKQNKVYSSTLALYLVPECSLWDSVGTNPKNSNFEHSNFGTSKLRTLELISKNTSRTRTSKVELRTSILRRFIRKF